MSCDINIVWDLDKILTCDNVPSNNIKIITNYNWAGILRPITQLYYCEQNPIHHPEGNVYNHTILVIDQAAKYRHELPKDWQRAFMWGMLLHDIGKPYTTDLEKMTAYNHDHIGAKYAKIFMESIYNKWTYHGEHVLKRICSIVKIHMRARMLVKQRSSTKAWKKLQDICRLDVLAYVSMCDSDGRGFPPNGKDEVFHKIIEIYEKLNKEMAE